MAFDYKKEYKEFYLPANRPTLVTVPPTNYVAVRGVGNPNVEDSDDDEPATVARMKDFAMAHNLHFATDEHRYHHEIYLSDPRKVAAEKCKTVIRIPVE